ncbi:MAG: hybrid sensor histidine kinase/response regulator [Roseitalea porphyridii]
MDDLLSEFLTETSESLAVLDVELVKLEQDPNDQAILSNIFRLVHTIKGTCGFLGLPRLEAVAHAGENVLGKFRDGELEVTPAAVTLILECLDQIKDILSVLESTEAEPEGQDTDLIARLNDMADGKLHAAAAVEDTAPAVEEVAEASAGGPVTSDLGFPVAAELLDEVEAAQAAGKQAASEEQIAAEMAAEAAREKAASAPKPAAAAQPPVKKAQPPAVSKDKAPANSGDDTPKDSSVAAQSIRVNVDLLENLMTLVSELVLTRNQLLQMVRNRDDSEFAVPLQRLSHITTDLQEGVMKTRMQPIGNAWAKLPRIVRDLAVEMHKKIDLQMIGAETELDRQVLELIKDPLTHMVRNSADHGLEDTEGRIAVGKPEVGRVVLKAFHEGGHIIIEIADDGRGINIGKVKAKAISNGLASEAELESLSDQQIQQFIFKAGFSTAEKVTSVSGRGVGMDVVRTNIEKIGGTIELRSVEGKGSTFIIKIPLTLAIVSALIVEAGGERFAIPQLSVLELVRASSDSTHRIERIHNSPVLRLRDRLLPLVTLSKLLGLGGRDDATIGKEGDTDDRFIVVSQVGSTTFGIIVDRVFDTEEIVVKPVAPILRHITLFSGNTILGDGSVIMILDPNGIATQLGEASTDHRDEQDGREKKMVEVSEQTTSLLIFRAEKGQLKAVPLALVARLEEIDLKTVEYGDDRPLVQYRGQLMPLVNFEGSGELAEEGKVPVLVFTDRGRSMGLVVEEIVDIVDERLKIELEGDDDALLGSAIVSGRSTDVIDASFYLTKAFGDWFAHRDGEDSKVVSGRVLLVDDSPFFRNLLSPLLSVSGFRAVVADSAESAMTILEKDAEFDAVVSDIEMPGMNGFEFAETMKADSRFKDMPIIALSSRATEADFERGRKVGFADYVAKDDRDSLIDVLRSTIASSGASR